MKKTFTSLAILLLIVVLCLTSCDISSVTNMLDVYSVTVTGSTDHLGQQLLPFYKAGDTVQIKLHNITCAGLYVYLDNGTLSYVGYDDKYTYYEFEMPKEDVTVHITFDPFYGRDNYTFDELIYWIEFIDNSIYNKTVNGVSLTINDYSDETSFVETRYSVKQVDIDNFKAIFDQSLIKVDYEEVVDTDVYTTYSFYEDGDEFYRGALGDLNFRDDFFSHLYNETSSPQPFRFEDPDFVLPTIEDPDYVTYSFKRENGIIYIKKYDDESYSSRYDYMSFVAFIPYDREVPDVTPVFYIDSKCGRINLINETIFELNGEYYEVISGSWAYNYV